MTRFLQRFFRKPVSTKTPRTAVDLAPGDDCDYVQILPVPVSFGYDEQPVIKLGVHEGQDVCWSPAEAKNLLVLGYGGSGLTELAKSVAVSAAAVAWPVWIATRYVPGEWREMRDWPNVHALTGAADDRCVMLRQVRDLLLDRMQFVNAGGSVDELQPLLVLVDGWGDLCGEFEYFDGGRSLRDEFVTLVEGLVSAPYWAKIHVVLTAHRPELPWMWRALSTGDFPQWVALGRMTPQAEHLLSMATGQTVNTRITTARRPGSSLSGIVGGTPQPMQAYMVPRDPKQLKGYRPAGAPARAKFALAALAEEGAQILDSAGREGSSS